LGEHGYYLVNARLGRDRRSAAQTPKPAERELDGPQSEKEALKLS
jgi:hypothetical protein